MDAAPAASPVGEYIGGFPPETQRLLHEQRTIIKAAEPAATERISYRTQIKADEIECKKRGKQRVDAQGG